MTTKEQNTNKTPWLDPYKYKPGESGNEGGRPKGKSITAELRKLLDEGVTAKELAKVLVAMSKDDLAALKELIDRTDGKVIDKRISINVAATPESIREAQERLLMAQDDTNKLLERYPDRNATE